MAGLKYTCEKGLKGNFVIFTITKFPFNPVVNPKLLIPTLKDGVIHFYSEIHFFIWPVTECPYSTM